jgi:16S rRNA A1518/A1519 N6-dimethyltransferase RsmA/KsgA/DIM1 with predicted DNA glycosylase/AP lyase activity
VDTAFVELKRRDNPLLPRTQMAEYEKFIQDCFSTPKLFFKTPRDQAGIPLDLKPSKVSLEQWLRLFAAAKK